MSKVIVTVAPTGGMASKAQNPNLPTQPDEIADSVHKSWKAGAAIAALHARQPEDQATCNAGIYQAINDRIRARCDIIIINSTGGGGNGGMLVPRLDGLFESNFDERLKGLDAGAEMATFDGMTFADVHRRAGNTGHHDAGPLRHAGRAVQGARDQAGMGGVRPAAYLAGRVPADRQGLRQAALLHQHDAGRGPRVPGRDALQPRSWPA